VKIIEQWVKALWLDSRVVWQYGTRSPDCVKLPQSSHSVFVDPDDLRARKKIIRESVRGRLQRNAQFWRSACRQLNPNIVLDVGLNYGECLFSCDYDSQARLIGIEANEGLRHCVEKSKNAHPNGSQMEIHFALASDTHRQASDFYVMQHWSGGSTAIAEVTDEVKADYKKVETKSLRIDELLKSTLQSDQLLLFKIDVEGFEPAVLRGMEESVHAVETAIGLIEYDTKLLDQSADSAEMFWESLQRQFRVFAFTSQNAMADMTGQSLLATKQRLGGGDFHTDLLLVRSKDSDKIDLFLDQWLEKPRHQAA